MTKFFTLCAMALTLGVSANAAGIFTCAQNTNYTIDANFMGAGNGCLLGDKVYSNFSAGLPTGTSVQFGIQGNQYTVTFSNTSTGGFGGGFTESYDVNIDATQAPANNGQVWTIFAVTGGMTDSSSGILIGTSTDARTISGGASGTVTTTDLNGAVDTPPMTGLAATTLHFSDVFTLGSNVNGTPMNITQVSDTVAQVGTTTGGTPEPVSMVLFGSGLLTVSLIGRKKLLKR